VMTVAKRALSSPFPTEAGCFTNTAYRLRSLIASARQSVAFNWRAGDRIRGMQILAERRVCSQESVS
jgi:hypothetical protein